MLKDQEENINEISTHLDFINEPVIAGIDEAGRGPVIGPMVYGLYVATLSEISNYKDSKLLKPHLREKFFQKMKNYAYVVIKPEYITSCMEAGTKNLNEISREAVIRLLGVLKGKCKNVKTVYIDGLGNNAKYKAELEREYPFNYVIENKADSTYQVVSGASIVAKFNRDKRVTVYNCGSGYSSDPITREWLKRNQKEFWGFPHYVRHSWLTIKRLLPVKKARKLHNKLDGFYIGPN